LPGMPKARVAGHKGRLCLHEFAGRTILVFQGRVHFYEGHPWSVVDRPVHIAHELGARTLILTNASGGICPAIAPGSLMAIRDHIPAMGPNWWRGIALGSPLPVAPYSPQLRGVLHSAATATGLDLPEGVYACVTGPSYETPAEIRAFRTIGADAI